LETASANSRSQLILQLQTCKTNLCNVGGLISTALRNFKRLTPKISGPFC
jgi:hypothetical protein